MKLNKYFSCSDVSSSTGVLFRQPSVNSLESRTQSKVITIINLVEKNLEKKWRVTFLELGRSTFLR